MNELIPYNGDLVIGDFRITPVGLEITGTPAFNQWHHVLVMLGQLETVIQLAIGDAINYGEAAYGEKYSQAINDLGKARQTLENYAWVARSIEISRRKEGVEFCYYAEVAALDPWDQDSLLQQLLVARETGTHDGIRWFRRKVKAYKGETDSEYEPVYVELVRVLEALREVENRDQDVESEHRAADQMLVEALLVTKKRLPPDYHDLIDDIAWTYQRIDKWYA